MPTLAHHAEVQKLALLLGTDAAQLAFLDKLDAAAIRALRERATAALFDADRHLFGRIAAATRLVPAAISAVIAEKALGALLCARVAGQLPAERAVDIAKRLHTGFLADVCVEIDPRHVRDLIAAMPVARIVDVARELARRNAHIVMGRFVDCLPEPAMRKVLDALRDDEALLRIGFFVEDPAQLSAVITLLPQARLRNLIVAAINDGDALWPEALALINAIAPAQRHTMAAIAAALDAPAINRMIALTHAQKLWPSLLPLVAEMDDADRAHLGSATALHDDEVLSALIEVTHEADLWHQLLPLVAQMDAELQLRAARIAERHGADVIERMTTALRALATPAGPAARARKH